LRVGREGIVSFPNFGYWKNRLQVLLGNMPVSDVLPYQWYDTPNVHLCTLDDFEDLCATHQVRILDRRVMTGGSSMPLLPNLLGSTAVYRFKRDA
jgi:methionine biosynthesis protein MetW